MVYCRKRLQKGRLAESPLGMVSGRKGLHSVRMMDPVDMASGRRRLIPDEKRSGLDLNCDLSDTSSLLMDVCGWAVF